jgi:glutamate dehydrogenase/leucine dehydrogenase
MTLFDNIEKNLEKLSGHLDLTDNEKKLLLSHKAINKASLNVDGKEYDAWRIVHNTALGPGKGGIRFHHDVSEDEVKSLSFWMSMKTSLAQLPYGGAKGGVSIDPKELDRETLEKISRAYVQAFHEFIGENKDIPAPDVYTSPTVMGWMLDEFEKIKGRHEPGMITGKPIELGGCSLRGDATSRGGKIVLDLFLKRKGLDPKTTTVAVQGFGNAGMNIASMLHESGYRIIAASDSRGGIIDRKGLDTEEMKKVKSEKGSVTNLPDARRISNKELLEADVDVLILAALENQITHDNADRVKARVVLELANGPVTSEADDILHGNGITVIPDILASAGGVIVSYCEWSQNKTGNVLSKEYMKEVLEKKLTMSFDRIYDACSKDKDLSMRSAAYSIAIRNILNAERARGNLG